MKDSRKTLIGLAGLFAAGVAIGALYAPDKGARTRRRISRKSRWFLHSAADAIEEGKDNLLALRDQIKDELEKVDEKLKQLSRCQQES